jgi:hypothetical protein
LLEIEVEVGGIRHGTFDDGISKRWRFFKASGKVSDDDREISLDNDHYNPHISVEISRAFWGEGNTKIGGAKQS